MTERERLIELIGKELLGYASWDTEMALAGNYTMPSVEEVIADKILKDGWIRPPCRVGQTIYYNCCGKIYKGECHAITIHKNSIQVHLYDFDGDNASYPAKRVYTSREKAEQALQAKRAVSMVDGHIEE